MLNIFHCPPSHRSRRTTGPTWPREVDFFPLDGDIQRSRRGSMGSEKQKRMSMRCPGCIRLYQYHNLKCWTQCWLSSCGFETSWFRLASFQKCIAWPLEQATGKDRHKEQSERSYGSRLNSSNWWFSLTLSNHLLHTYISLQFSTFMCIYHHIPISISISTSVSLSISISVSIFLYIYI